MDYIIAINRLFPLDTKQMIQAPALDTKSSTERYLKMLKLVQNIAAEIWISIFDWFNINETHDMP